MRSLISSLRRLISFMIAERRTESLGRIAGGGGVGGGEEAVVEKA